MTMPHLMNCGHSDTGWCLNCVKELHDQFTAAERQRDEMEQHAAIHLEAANKLQRENEVLRYRASVLLETCKEAREFIDGNSDEWRNDEQAKIYLDSAIAGSATDETPTPAPSPAQATEVERLQEALKKIASAKHGDTSCSLPAQGYGELECAVIEAEDYLARIALAALTPPAAQVAEQGNAPAECGKDGE